MSPSLLRASLLVSAHAALLACGTPATLDAATGDASVSDASPLDASPDVAPLEAAVPVANPGRDILRTALTFDLAAHSGRARIELAADPAGGASFEAAGLTIHAVRDGASASAVPYRFAAGRLDVALPAGASAVEIDFGYQDRSASGFDGATPAYTFLWPYYCGNLFPCHSDPADGARFELTLTGVPAGQSAVYPAMLGFDAPSYQLAWAVGSYSTIDLGTTPAGTHLTVRHLAGHETAARTATASLRDAFAWYESTLGPYAFGSEAGSVEVPWGPGAYGGMEHHPLWHVGSASLADELTHVHEAAHGWFGDAIRLACWEDFVLSEGTVSYLAARALGAVHGDAAEAAIWARYDGDAGGYGVLAWPAGCHTVDVLRDHLFTNAPYMRGANFYRALERRVTRPVLDAILRRFVLEHRGSAAGLTDMLALVRTVSSYDAAACADAWLRPSASGVRGPDTCP